MVEGRLKKESYIDCSTVLTVDKDFIVKKVGKLSQEKAREVLDLVGEILGI